MADALWHVRSYGAHELGLYLLMKMGCSPGH